MTAVNKPQPWIFVALLVAAAMLTRNLYQIFLVLPDDAEQGGIYRILFFHVPALWAGMLAFFAAFVTSIAYLVKKEMRYDHFSVAAIEVGLLFSVIGTVMGMLWARPVWGIWWTWDARLTSMFICILLYFGYLILRRAVSEARQRAQFAAIFSIFAFVDIPIVWYSIRWWRTQHPQPIVGEPGAIDPAMKNVLYTNLIPMLCIVAVLVAIRMYQEELEFAMERLRRRVNAIS
jgi:heme exporter protein C